MTAMTSSVRTEVADELAALFERGARAAEWHGAQFSDLWLTAARHAQGGKLIRPLLLIDLYEALDPGGASRRAAVRIAAAIEALHFAFLLHDDVIDGDVVRRGTANLIGELTETSGAAQDSPAHAGHWAQAGAILAGDLLISTAHLQFARAVTPGRERLLDLLEDTVIETSAGEFADVTLSDGIVAPDLHSVLAMTRRKTASYSFQLPLRAAAILAGSPAAIESRLDAAGAHLGLAYQLQDDLLSTFGDATRHGKDAYSDLREGKLTAIICYARETSLWPRIEPHFGDANLSTRSAEHVRDLLVQCGAHDFVRGLVTDQLTAFAAVVDEAQMPESAVEVLREIARRIEGRDA